MRTFEITILNKYVYKMPHLRKKCIEISETIRDTASVEYDKSCQTDMQV